MPAIQLELSITVASNAALPEARAWIDLQLDASLATEVEVPLARVGETAWAGSFFISESLESFCYRIGVAAHTGAIWSLSMHDVESEVALHSDSDSLPVSKCHLVGTISASSRARRARVPA